MKNGWTKDLIAKLASYCGKKDYKVFISYAGEVEEIDTAENPEWAKQPDLTPFDSYRLKGSDEYYPIESLTPYQFMVSGMELWHREISEKDRQFIIRFDDGNYYESVKGYQSGDPDITVEGKGWKRTQDIDKAFLWSDKKVAKAYIPFNIIDCEVVSYLEGFRYPLE